MKGKQNQETARRIVKYYNDHLEDRSATNQHFQDEGIPLRTIQNVLKRYIDDGRVDYSWKSGPARSVLTKTNLRKVRGKFISRPSISGRKVAKEVGISEKSVRRAKSELGIITRKKITAPKYVKDQRERCKQNAWKLYKRLREKLVVMDDETYVAADPSQIPGNHYYNEARDQPLDPQQKTKPKQKFFKKYLVWQAIASNGTVSEPFITTGTINAKIYKDECLKRLIGFLDSLGSRNEIIFWPDMASSHYANEVIKVLETEGIDYVSKVDNLPNCPQLRPIEKFWAICKDKYKALPEVEISLSTFKRRWVKISEEVARNSGLNLFKNFTSRLIKVGKKGLDSLLDSHN